MKNIYKTMVVVILTVATPLLSFAGSITSNLGVGVNARTGNEVNNNTEMNSDIKTETNTDNKSNLLDLDLDTNIDVSNNGEENDKIGDNRDNNVTADIQNDNEISSDGTPIKLKLNSRGVAVVSPAQVTSENDLEIFTENSLLKNESVRDINIDSKGNGDSFVEVVYNHPGKFLGFIPVNVPSKTYVMVDSNNTMKVKSRLAWWSFLVSGENYIKNDIESTLSNDTQIKAYVKTDISAKERALIANRMIADIEASSQTY